MTSLLSQIRRISLLYHITKKLSVISHEPSTVTTSPIYGASCYSMGSLQDSSSSVFQQSGNGRGGSYSNKPGWADYVSDLYKDSRDMGKMWCNAGKPRQGQIFELYRQSK